MKGVPKRIVHSGSCVTGSKCVILYVIRSTPRELILSPIISKHMDTHERIYRCLQPECSKLKGFTYAGGLQRHEKHVHKMHGVVEFYCPQATCNRAEGGGKPFTRKENRADHLQRKHNNKVTTSSMANRPIAPNTGMKRKRALSITEETEASGETARLKSTIEQLERRIEQLEEARVGRQLPEEEQ
jgi:hypothetical protein